MYYLLYNINEICSVVHDTGDKYGSRKHDFSSDFKVFTYIL